MNKRLTNKILTKKTKVRGHQKEVPGCCDSVGRLLVLHFPVLSHRSLTHYSNAFVSSQRHQRGNMQILLVCFAIFSVAVV